MTTKECLQILRNEIQSVTAATVDREGRPAVRVIDIMLVDDSTLYFMTTYGKAFYDQLMEQNYVALSGVCGGEEFGIDERPLHRKAITIRGHVACVTEEKLEEVFAENPFLAPIAASPRARNRTEIFCIKEGRGEYLDLSTKPFTREEFFLGIDE